jgi:hypothetical protein
MRFSGILMLTIITAFAFAKGPKSIHKPTMLQKDSEATVLVTWTGVGDISEMTVTNTGLLGQLDQPFGWPGYDGTQVADITADGNTFAYPANSGQYYIYSMGPWFGGQLGDEVRTTHVAVGAYSSISDLAVGDTIYQSDQHIAGTTYKKFLLQPELGLHPDQSAWPFTDQSVNDVRSAENALEAGSFLSDQDVYTVFGDYIPETEAVFFELDNYDGLPLGVKVEQRVYSFFSEKMIFTEYAVTNMNAEPIRDFFFGYFSDADIGDDYTDDLTGYNLQRQMIFAYDADGEEADFITDPGYVGTVFLSVPAGLTAVHDLSPSDFDPELWEQDHAKYELLRTTNFENVTEPSDIRQLASSGPIEVFNPGETLHFAIAQIAADDSLELFAVADRATAIYNNGYIFPYARLQKFTLDNYTPAIDDTLVLSARIEHPADAPPDSVIAFVTLYDGSEIHVELRDNGVNGDAFAGDHRFENDFVVPETGVLTFEIGVFNEEKGIIYQNNMPVIYTEQPPFASIEGTSLPGNNQVHLLNSENHFGDFFSLYLRNTSTEPLSDVLIHVTIDHPHLDNYNKASSMPNNYVWEAGEVFTVIPFIYVTPDPAFISHDQEIAYRVEVTNIENGHRTILFDTLTFTDNLPPYPISQKGLLPLDARRLQPGTHQAGIDIIETAGIESIEVALLDMNGQPIPGRQGRVMQTKFGEPTQNIQWTVPGDTTGLFRVGVRMQDSLDNQSDWYNLGEFANTDYSGDGNVLLIDLDYNNFVHFGQTGDLRQPDYLTWLRNDPAFEKNYIDLLTDLGHDVDVFRPDIDDWSLLTEAILNHDYIIISTGALNFTSADFADIHQHYLDYFAYITELMGENPLKVMLFAESDMGSYLSFKLSTSSTSFPYFITEAFTHSLIIEATEAYADQISGYTVMNNHRPLLGTAIASRYASAPASMFWDEVFLEALDVVEAPYPQTVTHFAPDGGPFGEAKVIATTVGMDLWENQDFARDYLAFGLDWLDTFTSVDQVETQFPTELTLYANYPNPFNPTTTIEYYLPKAGEVTLEVFNVLGQKVVTLTDGLKSAGKQTVVWDATDMRGNAVASGTYFYQLRSGGKVESRRMVLLK